MKQSRLFKYEDPFEGKVYSYLLALSDKKVEQIWLTGKRLDNGLEESLDVCPAVHIKEYTTKAEAWVRFELLRLRAEEVMNRIHMSVMPQIFLTNPFFKSISSPENITIFQKKKDGTIAYGTEESPFVAESDTTPNTDPEEANLELIKYKKKRKRDQLEAEFHRDLDNYHRLSGEKLSSESYLKIIKFYEFLEKKEGTSL